MKNIRILNFNIQFTLTTVEYIYLEPITVYSPSSLAFGFTYKRKVYVLYIRTLHNSWQNVMHSIV